MIRSPHKNSYCISANAMQLLPVLPQQLGHKFGHTVIKVKGHPSIIIWTNLVDFDSLMLPLWKQEWN